MFPEHELSINYKIREAVLLICTISVEVHISLTNVITGLLFIATGMKKLGLLIVYRSVCFSWLLLWCSIYL